jgi:hypothetical protein
MEHGRLSPLSKQGLSVLLPRTSVAEEIMKTNSHGMEKLLIYSVYSIILINIFVHVIRTSCNLLIFSTSMEIYAILRAILNLSECGQLLPP